VSTTAPVAFVWIWLVIVVLVKNMCLSFAFCGTIVMVSNSVRSALLPSSESLLD
jgi:hypothetical protein